MGKSALTIQLDRIENDILSVLDTVTGDALTVDEMYARSPIGCVKNNVGVSSFGWPFALEKLEKKHLIIFVSPNRWRIPNIEERLYISAINQYVPLK